MIAHTENETTVKVGQAIATVIADTISPEDKRITTLELVYPRYIHAEFLTHRQFSRNSSSSRATPLKVTLEEVRNDPVFFDFVGKNQSGMVASELIDEEKFLSFKEDWKSLGAFVANYVEDLFKYYNIHKQTLNRALEPWLRIKTLVTATEWDNFFKLRLAPDAQPEIKSLALAMQGAMERSYPKNEKYHTPYVHLNKYRTTIENIYKISAARCARVSYAKHDNSPTTAEEDLKLAERLLESGHMSPFEHVATYEHGKHANFYGWRSYRNMLGK